MIKKIVGGIMLPILIAGSGCGIAYGIKYKQVNDAYISVSGPAVKEELRTLKEKVSLLTSAKAELENQYSSLETRYNALDELKQTLESQNSELTTDNESLQNRINELIESKTQLENEMATLQDRITGLNSTIAELNQTLEEERTLSSESILELETQIEALQITIASQSANISKLETQVSTYESQVISLNTEIANLNNTVVECQKEIEKYKELIEELKKLNSCVVTFTVEGELFNTQQVNKTESPVVIDNPSSEDYTFEGWAIKDTTEIVDPFTYSVTEDIEFVAVIRKFIKVNFMVDDIVYNTQNLDLGEELQAVETPIKEHYEFKGWSLDGQNIIDIEKYQIVEDTTFIAVFEIVGVLDFTFDDGVLKKYNGTDTEIIIPTSYSVLDDGTFVSGNDIYVTSIGNGAFSGKTQITSIIFEKDSRCISIGNSAFYNCSNLVNLILPDSLISFGSSNLEKSVSLNFNVFNNCNYIGSEDNPYMILVKACSTEIDHVNISSSCKIVYRSAFSSCKNLTSVFIPKNVLEIQYLAFGYCSNLNSVEFEESSLLTLIDSSAFYGCSNLTSVFIPKNVLKIGDRAFYSCARLSSLTFENNSKLEIIGAEAFYSSNISGNLVLPQGLKNIGSTAFRYSSLTSVWIPSSVTTAGKNCFVMGPKDLAIYCESSSRPSGFSTEWNYSHYNGSSGVYYSVKYGYSYERYLEIIGA